LRKVIARKGEQKLAKAGMSWLGMAGAGRDWKELARAIRELAGAG